MYLCNLKEVLSFANKKKFKNPTYIHKKLKKIKLKMNSLIHLTYNNKIYLWNQLWSLSLNLQNLSLQNPLMK